MRVSPIDERTSAVLDVMRWVAALVVVLAVCLLGTLLLSLLSGRMRSMMGFSRPVQTISTMSRKS